MKYIIAFLLLCSPFQILAKSANATADLATYFVADSLLFNHHTGMITYSGHVRINRANTHLTANTVLIYRDKNGAIQKAIAIGWPAHYTDVSDNKTDSLEAFGNNMEYDVQKKRVVLIGAARVIKALNSLTGPYIIYDMVGKTLTSIPVCGAKKPQSIIVLHSLTS